MDVIALSKAMKAKKAIEELDSRLGSGVQDVHTNVKTRLESIESKYQNLPLIHRVSSMEAQVAININKHNLRLGTMLNHEKYKLTDLVYDDLADISGVDMQKSSNVTHDAQNKKISQTSTDTEGVLVFTLDTLDIIPTSIIISIV